MANKKEVEKLRINALRVTTTFLSAAILGALLIFMATFWLFIDVWPWDWRQYFIIGVWFVSSLGFYLLSLRAHYYVLCPKYIIVHRYRKELAYYYNEILYIDKEYSRKHKTVKFVTNHGDIRYLTFDQKGKLYDTMLEKCGNLIPLDMLLRRFPSLKGLK